jgi:exopolysaccharide biosynthesis protein
MFCTPITKYPHNIIPPLYNILLLKIPGTSQNTHGYYIIFKLGILYHTRGILACGTVLVIIINRNKMKKTHLSVTQMELSDRYILKTKRVKKERKKEIIKS